MEILKVKHLCKVYGKGSTKVIALDDINFSVEKGEFVSVIGSSGSGKSTLLHILGAVDKPTLGHVYIDKEDIFKKNDNDLAILRRRKVGLIYQFYNLIPILNVVENISLPVLLDNKKVDNAEIGTKITQNYESVQIAWNSISEFIKFLNAMLQILDKNKKLLMSLDKTGMHFFNSGKEIGNIGINNAEVSFYINGDVSGSSMSWGINKTINGEMKYFPVFSYSGYNTDSGTEFGGKFLLEAPLIMQEKTLFLGQDMNSSYIQGQQTDNRKKTTIGNTDDLYVYNSAGNLILVLNSSYLKLYEQLEMYADPLAAGGYDFNFKDNSLIGIDRISASGEISGNNGTFNDIANSDNIRRFNNTGTDYLIAVLKSSAGGGSIYCQNANSDKKFKKNIKDAEISAVDTIMKIRHRQYDWKSNGKHEYVGYIAQELEKVNPNLVSVIKENSEETYLLNEKALIATATKAIQEQQKQIEKLKEEINNLKGEKYESDKNNSNKD